MNAAERARFDRLLEDAIDSLPASFRGVIEEVPVIVVDRPDAKLIAELRREGVLPEPESGTNAADDEELMGLHSGVAITEQSVERSGDLPGQIHVFREGVVAHAGGWDQEHADEEIYEEIRVTLLHEIGHHFGLDEDDLDQLGYA
jgi:predicted Zn-dependent protease with MMP-like domain